MMKKFAVVLSVILCLISHLVCASVRTQQTAALFNEIKRHPQQLQQFIAKMPKGGDLHNHLAGSIDPEQLLAYGHHQHYCLIPNDMSMQLKPVCQPAFRLDNLSTEWHAKVDDAWSMRHFNYHHKLGHDHFFASFGKFYPLYRPHRADALVTLMRQAAKENIEYLELMVVPDDGRSGKLGVQVLHQPASFEKMQKILEKADIDSIVTKMRINLEGIQHQARHQLQCATHANDPACQVKVRFLYSALRTYSPQFVFANLLAGFKLAASTKQVVGINLVAPEDDTTAMQDYHQQMLMIGYLHQHYPNVNISLHAGELTAGMMKKFNAYNHIRDAIKSAHAKRIGHGVDILHERHPFKLITQMAEQHIMVEINLTSNADILGIKGICHPFLVYLDAGVPVALSTDDQGILQTDLNHEFLRAVTTYDLSYRTLKTLVYNSMQYSFLPGASLWDYQHHYVKVCNGLKDGSLAPDCDAFLQKNEKAAAMCRLEQSLQAFEKRMSQQYLQQQKTHVTK